MHMRACAHLTFRVVRSTESSEWPEYRNHIEMYQRVGALLMNGTIPPVQDTGTTSPG